MITHTLYALVDLDEDDQDGTEVSFEEYRDALEYAQDNGYEKYRIDVITLHEVDREEVVSSCEASP